MSGIGGQTSRTTGALPFGEPEPAERRTSLLVYHREGVEMVALRPGAPVVVGRAGPADVVIADASLSRAHARFTLDDGAVVVEDLGSTNGTFHRGARVTRAAVVAGEEISLGAVVAVVHVLSSGAATSAFAGASSHERFVEEVDREVARARHFGRPTTVLMARSIDRAHVRRWAPGLQQHLRAVDVTGLYSADTIEVLLPEVDAPAAAELARALLDRSGVAGLAIAVAAFPGAARSADELVEAARDAVIGASVPGAVVVAPGGARRTLDRPARGPDDAPVASSPAMARVFATARRLARGVIPVLLVGETGSGKEVVARFIHDEGPRAAAPLVCVNCGALPESLVESTLFGHEKGAFTGAVAQQRGVFEAANGGTVLLDEIGELPPSAQASLLRVLETKRVTRVGSAREIDVDVRVLAATHRDLEAMAAAGAFRQDLVYRLNALTLRLPPLRERREDIPELAERFLRRAALANGTAARVIDADAMALLVSFDWPGNVRELRNALDRAAVIAVGEVVTADDLPDRVREREPPRASPSQSGGPSSSFDDDFRTQLDRAETEILVRALERAGWNQTEAARRLRMPLRTLVYKLRAHGIRKLGYGVT